MPEVVERDDRDRMVTLSFPGRTVEGDEYDEREATHTLVPQLSVSHNKAGVNHFAGTVTNEDSFSVSLIVVKETKYPDRGKAVSFGLFTGLGLMRIHAGNRFSRKRLNEAVDTALARLTELEAAGDERVLAYLRCDDSARKFPNGAVA